MRPSLLPGLLAAAARNAARGAESIALFEIGRRYLEESERPTLGLVLAGPRGRRHWRGEGGRRRCLRRQGRGAGHPRRRRRAGRQSPGARRGASDAYHPGQSGRLCLGPKTVLAEFGALHPRIARTFDLDGAGGRRRNLPRRASRRKRGGRGPQAQRLRAAAAAGGDARFRLPGARPSFAADQLLRAVRGADKESIAGASLFDLFTGAGVPEGQKSLAIEVVLQPSEKSFTEEELKAISERITAAAAKLGATLRA